MKNLYLITFIISVFIFGCQSGNKNKADTSDTTMMSDSMNDHMTTQNTGMGNMMGMMHKSMMQLDTMKMTGDPDYDFAMMMQMHHKGGISMVDEEISYGKDSATVKLAKKIKDGQQKDLQELQKFTSNNSAGKSNSEFMQEMNNHIQTAKDAMNSNMNISGNTDKDFASLMSMHHKHGMDMARTEIKYGKKSEMKTLAQKMLNEQENERKQLEELKSR